VENAATWEWFDTAALIYCRGCRTRDFVFEHVAHVHLLYHKLEKTRSRGEREGEGEEREVVFGRWHASGGSVFDILQGSNAWDTLVLTYCCSDL